MKLLRALLAWLSPALCGRCGQHWSRTPAVTSCPCCGFRESAR